MNLVKFEFKKIFTPLTVIALSVMLFVNMYVTIQYQKEYALSPFKLEIVKSEYAEKSGEINDEWIAERYEEEKGILSNPKYLKTDAELKACLDELSAQGYSDEEIEYLKSFPYTLLNDAGSVAFDTVTRFMSAACFYENAEREMNFLLEEYSSDATICDDIKMRYGYLTDEYKAYCDYDFAYTQIQYTLSNAFAFSVGIPVLIGLASLFATEHSRRTDALIFSTKHGRAAVARAKLSAGAIYAALVWFIMAASVIAYSFAVYGTEGFNAYWQSFADITAPFPWTVGQAVIIELATSFIGTLFFAFAVMLLSELTKSVFVATVLSATLLLAPMFISIRAGLLKLLPTCLMRGSMLWSTYAPAKLFGAVFPMQYLILALAAILGTLCLVLTSRRFAHRSAA